MTSEVRLGPLAVQYIAAGEQVPQIRQGLVGFEEGDDLALQTSLRIRRILMPLPSGRYVYLVLHWDDGTNLTILDELVAAGADYSSMFEGALAGTIMTVRCDSCSARYRAAVADTGNPLFDNLTERLRSHSYVSLCPRCGYGIQPHVMEIIRELSDVS